MRGGEVNFFVTGGMRDRDADLGHVERAVAVDEFVRPLALVVAEEHFRRRHVLMQDDVAAQRREGLVLRVLGAEILARRAWAEDFEKDDRFGEISRLATPGSR